MYMNTFNRKKAIDMFLTTDKKKIKSNYEEKH